MISGGGQRMRQPDASADAQQLRPHGTSSVRSVRDHHAPTHRDGQWLSADGPPNPSVPSRTDRVSSGSAGGDPAVPVEARRPRPRPRNPRTTPRPARSSRSRDGRCRPHGAWRAGTATNRSNPRGHRSHSVGGGTTTRRSRRIRRSRHRSAGQKGRCSRCSGRRPSPTTVEPGHRAGLVVSALVCPNAQDRRAS